jgi:hypothetical protein
MRLKMLLLIVIIASLVHPVESVSPQAGQPAAEYNSLLNLRFYEQTGGFLVDTIQLVFPPEGSAPLEATFTRGGETVDTVPLNINRIKLFPAFAGTSPIRHTGVVKLGKAGDYLLTVKLAGQPITTMPFSLKVEPSSDPYRPGQRFIREGPWRNFGYLSIPIERQDDALSFSFWTCLPEVGATKDTPCTLHLMRGAQEIAQNHSTMVISQTDWQFFRVRMVTSLKPVQNLTMAALGKTNGDLKLVVKAQGRPIKSFGVRVAGGQLQRLDRSDMNTSPHTDFISARFIDTLSSSGTRDQMLDAYWVKAGGN